MNEQPNIRNKEIRRVRVADVEDAPWNFRTHPDSQAAALEGLIDEIGFYSYPDVYESDGGVLRLIDGHLRKALLVRKYGPDAEIEVNVTTFSEAEAKKATLTKDPLAAMATTDAAALDALLREVETADGAVASMLSEIAADVPDAHRTGGAPRQCDFPITPVPGEQYNYVMIFCDNEPDFAALRTMLFIEQKKCYKSQKVAAGRVLKFQDFHRAWEASRGT
jgi:hypothetical protein